MNEIAPNHQPFVNPSGVAWGPYREEKAAMPLKLSLKPGEKFVLEINEAEIPQPLETDSSISAPVVYRDEYIIAVSKPPNLPSQPTLDPRRLNLFDWLKRTEGLEYLGQHHR
ncbi:MAG: hypothetical protein EOP02_18930, partial [Proteobacteria bacterium]